MAAQGLSISLVMVRFDAQQDQIITLHQGYDPCGASYPEGIQSLPGPRVDLALQLLQMKPLMVDQFGKFQITSDTKHLGQVIPHRSRLAEGFADEVGWADDFHSASRRRNAWPSTLSNAIPFPCWYSMRDFSTEAWISGRQAQS